MKLFRNAEVRRAALVFAAVAALAVVCAWCADVRFGLFTAAVCAAFFLIFYVTYRRRYRRIAALSEDIDRILHDDTPLALDACSEGELSILQSELQKMIRRLREQQLRLSEEKNALADALADISHQLRTPLTSINLLVSLISASDISDDRRRALSHELFDRLSQVDRFITALLKLSKLDAGAVTLAREELALDELLKRATASLLIPMELRSQTLRITAEGTFCGDPAWTCEALSNIVKNCMEHTPENGTVEICAESNALFTQIVITDDGNGIDAEDLPHIFERFYKGKNADERSVGIGLALARTIITAQNGTLKAENRHPHGAKFTARFYKGIV